MPTIEDRRGTPSHPLNDYLAQLSHELEASPEEAEEVLREIRSHLEMAAHDADTEHPMEHSGDDTDTRTSTATCWVHALQRFGTAKEIGRELRRVHGRATWTEAGLAALPLLLVGSLATTQQMRASNEALPLIVLGLVALMTLLAWRTHWPAWWWAWLGWLPYTIVQMPNDADATSEIWGTLGYIVLLALVIHRDWLEATLAIYPLPTAYALHHLVLTSAEVRGAGWSAQVVTALGVCMAVVWTALLLRTLRTPSGTTCIAMALESHGITLALHALIIIVARLWPTHPYPYPFTLRYFAFVTVPYALFHGLPLLLFSLLTSMPATLALMRVRAHRCPPSHPVRSS